VSQRIKFKDVRHIVHVAIVALVVIATFVIARSLSVPESFGQYGHYRGKAIEERMNPDRRNPLIIFQGAQTCLECHEEETGMWPGFEAWQKGKHSSVTCENCHSNVEEHVQRRRADPTLEKFVIGKDGSPQRCLMCHYGLAARPKVVPLCEPDENHAEYLEALKQETEEVLGCTVCHEDFRPHNPKLPKKGDES